MSNIKNYSFIKILRAERPASPAAHPNLPRQDSPGSHLEQ